MSPPKTLILQKIRVLRFQILMKLINLSPLISLRVVSEPWKNFDGSWITWILELQPKFLRTSTRSHSQSKGSCLAHALLKRPLIKLNNFYLDVFGYYGVYPEAMHTLYQWSCDLWVSCFYPHNTYNNLMSLQFVMCYYITTQHYTKTKETHIKTGTLLGFSIFNSVTWNFLQLFPKTSKISQTRKKFRVGNTVLWLVKSTLLHSE